MIIACIITAMVAFVAGAATVVIDTAVCFPGAFEMIVRDIDGKNKSPL